MKAISSTKMDACRNATFHPVLRIHKDIQGASFFRSLVVVVVQLTSVKEEVKMLCLGNAGFAVHMNNKNEGH